MRIFILLLISAAISSCQSNQQSSLTDKQVDSVLANYTAVKATKTEAASNWQYSDNEDKMDNSKAYFAQTTSANELYFDFPYNGGSSFVLTVRKRKQDGTSVILEVDKGQFLTDIDGGYGRIKFDDEKPISISYTETNDGSANVVFLHPENKIIQKLKKAKKVIIETEFYQEGRKQIEFNVEGLQWSH